MPYSPRCTAGETTAVRSPRPTTREKPAQQQRPSTAKHKEINNFEKVKKTKPLSLYYSETNDIKKKKKEMQHGQNLRTILCILFSQEVGEAVASHADFI